MFSRSLRLTRPKDVQKVYRQGSSAATRFLFVRCLATKRPQPRFAVVVSKKIAKRAVVRNRLKRLVRQAMQELLLDPTFAARLTSVDCVVTVHRDPEPPYTLERMKPEVARCFERLPSA